MTHLPLTLTRTFLVFATLLKVVPLSPGSSGATVPGPIASIILADPRTGYWMIALPLPSCHSSSGGLVTLPALSVTIACNV